MHNFLDPTLLPKVSTKCTPMERYEVENLVSSNFLVKSRGFIAYTTTKPPTDIDFQLVCNISLSYILISSRIGSHKCTAIEIFVRNSSNVFVSICKANYDEHSVVFCNSRHYSKSKHPKTTQKNYYMSYFRSNEFRAFTNTDTVRIRILRTNGTIPCLAGVEIWGNVSKTCSYETAQTIHRLLSKNAQSSCPNKMTSNKFDDEVFEIPDDFKDALTYELMAIPMTLPSGHTVDQSTLEKCLATDASYGRHECDPFTGLQYINGRRPVLNVALKTRIDMFLLKNSHLPEFYGVKRTLGRASDTLVVPQRTSHSIGNYSDITQVSKKIKINMCDGDNTDLNKAIAAALTNKDFVRFTTSSLEDKCSVIKSCAICDKTECLYILLCKHLYCRDCLINIVNLCKCKVCDMEFSRSDLQRHYC